jgi:hypothetical protein
MIRLTPTVPEDCDVIGQLYWDEDRTVLGEDMIDIVLPNGKLISCGWYPDSDPNGAYKISVSDGFEELESIEISDVHVARSILEDLVVDFGHKVRFTSASSSEFKNSSPRGGFVFA